MTLGELAQIVGYMARLWPNFSADDETLNVWREWLGDYGRAHCGENPWSRRVPARTGADCQGPCTSPGPRPVSQ